MIVTGDRVSCTVFDVDVTQLWVTCRAGAAATSRPAAAILFQLRAKSLLPVGHRFPACHSVVHPAPQSPLARTKQFLVRSRRSPPGIFPVEQDQGPIVQATQIPGSEVAVHRAPM